MKRALFASLMIAAMGLATECLARGAGHCPDDECPTCKPGLFHRGGKLFRSHSKTCEDCGKHCGLFHKCHAHGRRRAQDEDLGYGAPPAAQVTYPYYTVRGPRDFLDPNPRGIGP
jgi:hypothetical protein